MIVGGGGGLFDTERMPWIAVVRWMDVADGTVIRRSSDVMLNRHGDFTDSRRSLGITISTYTYEPGIPDLYPLRRMFGKCGQSLCRMPNLCRYLS